MCTVLVLLRPGDSWPLLLASNRDERLDRPFDPPGRWWPEAPGVTGWRDATAGGSWLAVNDAGTVATIVNGMHELGPAPGKASRGDVVVQLLAKRGAPEAAEAARRLHPARYRRFTLLVADREAAFVATCDGHALAVQRLAPGAHMLTPEGVDVSGAPRVDAYAEAFRAAAPPDPERGDWAAWIDMLRREDREDPHRAMTVVTDAGFGTVASTLVAIPAPAQAPIVLFASGPPTRTPFQRYVPDRFAAAVSNAHAR